MANSTTSTLSSAASSSSYSEMTTLDIVNRFPHLTITDIIQFYTQNTEPSNLKAHIIQVLKRGNQNVESSEVERVAANITLAVLRSKIKALRDDPKSNVVTQITYIECLMNFGQMEEGIIRLSEMSSNLLAQKFHILRSIYLWKKASLEDCLRYTDMLFPHDSRDLRNDAHRCDMFTLLATGFVTNKQYKQVLDLARKTDQREPLFQRLNGISGLEDLDTLIELSLFQRNAYVAVKDITLMLASTYMDDLNTAFYCANTLFTGIDLKPLKPLFENHRAVEEVIVYVNKMQTATETDIEPIENTAKCCALKNLTLAIAHFSTIEKTELLFSQIENPILRSQIAKEIVYLLGSQNKFNEALFFFKAMDEEDTKTILMKKFVDYFVKQNDYLKALETIAEVDPQEDWEIEGKIDSLRELRKKIRQNPNSALILKQIELQLNTLANGKLQKAYLDLMRCKP